MPRKLATKNIVAVINDGDHSAKELRTDCKQKNKTGKLCTEEVKTKLSNFDLMSLSYLVVKGKKEQLFFIYSS